MPKEELRWSSNFETGHPELDAQHREIIACTNCIAGFEINEYADIPSACERLVELMREHFETEEKLLDEIGFFGATNHKASHHRVLAETEAILGGCGGDCHANKPAACAPQWVHIVLEHLLKQDVLFKSAVQVHTRGY